MNENLFCKIFVLAATDRETVAEHVAKHLGGKRDGNAVVCDWGVVDVLNNDDADCSIIAGADGFLHFPYLIETEPETTFQRGTFVNLIGSLLESLWAERYGAVAACDFENELPRNGGYLPDSPRSTPRG